MTVEMANLPSKFEANTKEYCFTIIAQCHDSSTTVVIQGALNITENVPMTGTLITIYNVLITSKMILFQGGMILKLLQEQ